MPVKLCIAQSAELPADLAPLLEASLAEGFRFVERLREEWSSGVNRFAKPGEAFFVARHQALLAGFCGLSRDPFSTDPAVGRLRHLYVAAQYRRQGVGRALVQHALAGAGAHFAVVRVRTDTREADLFYLALGFSRPLSSRDATHELRLRGISPA